MKCLNCIQYSRCGCERKAWREHCCASLPHCVMLLQNKPGVSVALYSPLTHCFLHSDYPHLSRSLSAVMLSKFCFVNSFFWISPLIRAVAFFPTAILLLVSYLCFQFHYTSLYYFSVQNLCWQLLLFSSYFNDVPLIFHRISSQCDKLWFWQSLILSRNLL